MTDIRPDNRHRLAYLVGRIFHPYIICVPTLIAVLSDLPPDQILGWSALVLSLLLLPTLTFGFYLQRRGQELYRRQIRSPLYLLGWLSVLVCLALIVGSAGAARADRLPGGAGGLGAAAGTDQRGDHETLGSCGSGGGLLHRTADAG